MWKDGDKSNMDEPQQQDRGERSKVRGDSKVRNNCAMGKVMKV